MVRRGLVWDGSAVHINDKKKKWYTLGSWSFIISVAIFTFTYFMFHYLGPDGSFGHLYQEEPVKPFVTLLFGIWGVTFLFASVMSFLVGKIFFSDEE